MDDARIVTAILSSCTSICLLKLVLAAESGSSSNEILSSAISRCFYDALSAKWPLGVSDEELEEPKHDSDLRHKLTPAPHFKNTPVHLTPQFGSFGLNTDNCGKPVEEG